MALNTSNCNHLTPLRFKGLKINCALTANVWWTICKVGQAYSLQKFVVQLQFSIRALGYKCLNIFRTSPTTICRFNQLTVVTQRREKIEIKNPHKMAQILYVHTKYIVFFLKSGNGNIDVIFVKIYWNYRILLRKQNIMNLHEFNYCCFNAVCFNFSRFYYVLSLFRICL